ncbi:MAG: LysM peptidoglycan-binding domain-containing protein [Myxococcales bacterium]|nr:LysM peptidoglycan-binding domain-containing protein [Myxococcales bacterium]
MSRSLLFRVAPVVLVLSLALAASAQRLHTVVAGQTWSAIAKRYRVRVWDLAAANRSAPTRRLRVGQELVIPPRGVTYVRRGQTLSGIARKHEVPVAVLMRLNRLRSPGALRAGMRLRLPGYEPAISMKKRDWAPPAKPGTVRVRRDDRRAEIALVDATGRVLDSGLRALASFMRKDGRAGPQRPHPRLARLLARISDHFGGREIHLISGMRTMAGFTRGTSRHLQGRAADINVAGVPRRLVFEYCRSMGHTGCGYYPRSVFVHVDVRSLAAQWVDWSRPGKRPRYGTLRRPYRRRERRSAKRPRVTRRVTRPEVVPRQLEVVDESGQLVWFVDDRG